MSRMQPHADGGDDTVADAELLRLHVSGDTDAFGELFARHQDRLWAVALRTLGDPEQAADALQEAMISAFRRAGSFRGEARVTTWLHRVVVNACLDQVRRQKVRAADPLPDDEDRMAQLGTTDDDSAERVEEREDVTAALATLPWEQRATLVLVDMHGYSVEEAADMLGCPVGTVKSRCARGRARLLPLLTHLRNPQQTHRVEPVTMTRTASSAPPSPPAPGGDSA